MLTTDDESLAQRIRMLRSHGMTSLTWDRHQGHAYSYDVVDLGYNYRIDEIHSALGLVQLEKLTRNNALRKGISEHSRQAFQDSNLGLPFQNWVNQAGVEPAFHIFPILLPAELPRKAFIDHLREQGIQTSIHYPPIHLFQYYAKAHPSLRLPHTEAFAASEVTLPLYPGMSTDQLSLVINAVKQCLA